MARSMALSPMRRSSPLPPPVVAMMPRPILVTDPSPEFHSTRVAHNNRAERQKEDLVICGDLQLISSGGHSERGRGPSIVLVTYRLTATSGDGHACRWRALPRARGADALAAEIQAFFRLIEYPRGANIHNPQ